MRKLLIATTAALVLGTAGANATPTDTLNSILGTSYYSGATINSTSATIFGITIEATLANGTVVDNRYRLDGTLKKSDTTTTAGVQTETTYNSSGQVVKTDTSNDVGTTLASSGEDNNSTDATSQGGSGDHSGSDNGSSSSGSDGHDSGSGSGGGSDGGSSGGND